MNMVLERKAATQNSYPITLCGLQKQFQHFSKGAHVKDKLNHDLQQTMIETQVLLNQELENHVSLVEGIK